MLYKITGRDVIRHAISRIMTWRLAVKSYKALCCTCKILLQNTHSAQQTHPIMLIRYKM